MYRTNKMTAMSNISSSSTRYNNNNNNNNNRYSDGGRNKPMNGHSTVTAMKMKMKKKKGNKRNPDCSHKRMQRNQSLVFMKSSRDYYDNASLFIDRESDGNNSSKKRNVMMLVPVMRRRGRAGDVKETRTRALGRNNYSNERAAAQQRVLTKFLELPQVPIGQYVAGPTSYLHKTDSRIKQAWLAAILLCPSISNDSLERVLVCAFLVVVSATSLPRKVWAANVRNLALLSFALFVFASIGADGVPLLTQPREPIAALEGLENVHSIELAESYKYVLVHFGPITVTRRGVTIATNAACVTFTALQSAHLALCTTTPESLAFAMRWYLQPLKKVFKVNTDEIVFTLLLALRFTSIVFEETRNLSLGLASRALDWKSLGFRGSIDVFMQLLARLMESLFANAKAISEATESRGYGGNDDEDDDDFFDNERGYGTQDDSKYLRVENLVSVVALFLFVGKLSSWY